MCRIREGRVGELRSVLGRSCGGAGDYESHVNSSSGPLLRELSFERGVTPATTCETLISSKNDIRKMTPHRLAPSPASFALSVEGSGHPCQTLICSKGRLLQRTVFRERAMGQGLKLLIGRRHPDRCKIGGAPLAGKGQACWSWLRLWPPFSGQSVRHAIVL